MNFSALIKKFYDLVKPHLLKNQEEAAYILFSLIYTALKRNERINENTKIIIPRLSTIVSSKPDDFILYFFEENKVLSKLYQKEIREKDLKTLREEFKILYPLIELKEPFLCFILQDELKKGNLYRISKIYKNKRKKILEGIKKIKTSKIKDNLFNTINLMVKAFAEEIYDKKNFREIIFEKLS